MEKGYEIPVLDHGCVRYVSSSRSSPDANCEDGEVKLDIRAPAFLAPTLSSRQPSRDINLVNEFYIPEKWLKQNNEDKEGTIEAINLKHEFYTEMAEDFCKQAYDLYENMIESNVSIRMARMLLPDNIYVDIRSCMSLKELVLLSKLNGEPIPGEIQDYRKAILQIAAELFPKTIKSND